MFYYAAMKNKNAEEITIYYCGQKFTHKRAVHYNFFNRKAPDQANKPEAICRPHHAY